MKNMSTFMRLIIATLITTIVLGVVFDLASMPGPTFTEILLIVFAAAWCEDRDRQRRLGK